jgi:RNA polymerase-associated protein LEO1
LSRGAPRKPSFPPSRPPRRQEYSESEREESEYETEGEDIEHSPTAGREDELDEEDEYEEDVEEEAAMSDEEIQVRSHCLKLQFAFCKVGDVVNRSNLPV